MRSRTAIEIRAQFAARASMTAWKLRSLVLSGLAGSGGHSERGEDTSWY
jgi:hypothetical protein